jgi:hypothetical protein
MTRIHADLHPQHCSQFATTDLVGAAVLDELGEDVINAAEDLLPGGTLLLLLPPLLLLLLLAPARLRDEHSRLTSRHHHLAIRSLLFYTVLRIHEMDPDPDADPAIFVGDLQDVNNKKYLLVMVLFEGKFPSFFKDKKS